jgi:hypothetical protein
MLSFERVLAKHATISLFLALTILAFLFPNMVHQLYSHILGRFIIVIVISYLAMQHMLFGVFAAFIFVSIIQQNVYHEGFTAGAESEEPASDEKSKGDSIDSKKLSDLQEKLDEVSAVQEPNDLLSTDPTRKSDNSKKIQVDPSSKGSSEDVNASEPEAFTLYYSKY